MGDASEVPVSKPLPPTEKAPPTEQLPSSEHACCSTKHLPQDQLIAAAKKAIEHNPANATATPPAGSNVVLAPSELAVLISKYWGNSGVNLTVRFLEDTPYDLRSRILTHMNAWGLYANVQFTEVLSGGDVRISRTGKTATKQGGFWSYLGTDIHLIAADAPTMNLEGFTMDTVDSEFYRVVRHETGHTLGFPHEHLTAGIVNGIDRDKAIAYFLQNDDWSPEMTIAQVLTAIDPSTIIQTAQADVRSIMCYVLPASIMKNGVAVPGGLDIDATDADFARKMYPKAEAWQLLDNNAATVSAVSDAGNLYQLHNTGKIWRYTGPPMTGWQEIDNNPASIKIITSAGYLYQLHNTGRIWKYTGVPHTGWQMLDQNPATVDIVASQGSLYQLHNTGRIWQYTGTPVTGWQELDANPATKKIAASGGNLYQLHSTGRIWKYTGTPHTGWQNLDSNAATVDIVASGNELYQLHNTGKIWRYQGTPMSWQNLDGNPATKEIAAGPAGLYQIHNTGAIWKYTGVPMTGWKQLDSNAASMHIFVGNSVYQLHKTGLIWRYAG